MKTTNNLRTIQRLFLTSIILAIFNIGLAQTMYASATTISKSLSLITNGNDIEKSILKSNTITEKPVLEEMELNPDYWVNYLKKSITNETPEAVTTESNTSDLLDQMETDNNYWINYLKSTIETEDNTSVLDTMENDPAYWIHYLQSTVNTDAI